MTDEEKARMVAEILNGSRNLCTTCNLWDTIEEGLLCAFNHSIGNFNWTVPVSPKYNTVIDNVGLVSD